MTLRSGQSTSLPPGVVRGYALGSVATGAFGTVPGLLLLPYLTDRLGVAAGLAGAIVFLPKAWDVILNPIAGPDQRPHRLAVRPASAVPAAGWDRARPRLRRALRRARVAAGTGGDLGRPRLPRLRHRLRLLPGPLRRDARRDDRRLRRAHPADDLAGRDPGARHPRQRGLGSGDPRCRRPGPGLPRDGARRRRADPRRRARRLARHRCGPRAHGASVDRQPGGPAADRGRCQGLPPAARHVRAPGAGDRGDARRGRLRRPARPGAARARRPSSSSASSAPPCS